MKKLICLLLAALLLFSAACAETKDMRLCLNPNEYTLIEVVDYWYDDDGNEHNVQGTFGDYIMELEAFEGFDPEDVYTLTLSPDAVIELPNADGEIVSATTADLDAFVDAMRSSDAPISFYCDFEMDENGVLTKLVYCIPDECTADETVITPEYYNPNHYTLMMVEDAYQCDDDDYVVCASFGDWDLSDDSNAQSVGFDQEGVLIVVAPDAVIEMSANLDDEDNIPMSIDEFMALVHETLDQHDQVYSFYCEFDMNDAGVLTRLTYVYLPY